MDKPRLKELIDNISDLLPKNTSDLKKTLKITLKSYLMII